MSKRQSTETITKQHIHTLYAIASRVGLVESGNKNDDFHTLVYRLTKKQSVKDLTEKEFYVVKGNLLKIGNDDSRKKG